MPRAIELGDEAPNFDLASTEDVVLMLRDEVPRSVVLLYFFADPADERACRDLEALEGRRQHLATHKVQIFGVSSAKLDELKRLQRELSLRYPLLRDDRDFARSYGVQAAEEGAAAAPALFLVDRHQRVRWLANPLTAMDGALEQAERVLRGLPSPSAQYPRAIVNRWVDRWVN